MKTIEQLEAEMAEIDAELASINSSAEPLRQQMSGLDKRKSQLLQTRQGKASRVAELRKAPRVSDHAVLRFLERRYGFDFEDVRKSLLTPAVEQAMAFGAEGVKVEGGTLKIKGKTITTFVGSGANGGTKPKRDRTVIEIEQ